MAEYVPRSSMLVFGCPPISQDEIDAVTEVMKSGWLGTGPRTADFQEAFRNYRGADFAAATNSCTAALHLALVITGIQPGDEVITTPMTFCATANVILNVGARPVFVDCEKTSLNIAADSIEDSITEKTKAILPVHFAGRPCAMDKIMEIASRHKLRVIEDCAHAIESEYKGKPCGTFGDAGCFSFYVTKNITTVEGGMLLTNDSEIARKAHVYSLHGLSKDAWKRFSDEGYRHYFVEVAGYKYNMTDMQAVMGLKQMEKLSCFRKQRQEVWSFYDEALADLPLITPSPPEADTVHALHLYTVLVDTDNTTVTRDQLLTELHRRNIGTGVHYVALHLHPLYQKLGYRRGQFPNAEFISDRTLSLPLSGGLALKDAEDVVNALRDVFDKNSRKTGN